MWLRIGCALSLVWSLAVCGGRAGEVTPGPSLQPGKWSLAWADEFDGPTGSRPDQTRWVYDRGGSGWGNEELQTYTDRLQNAVVRDGVLVITARAESFTGTDGIPRSYTSARLKTQSHFAQTYGRFEARMQLPRGQGIWPAFWMLGADISAVGWPQCGEIDIMENIGREPAMVHGTIHGPGYSGGASLSGAASSADGRPFADGYHVFAVEWEAAAIRWYVDGRQYFTQTPADLPAGGRWVFDHDHFLLLNLAVGGRWPGNPDPTTTFPQELKVDYVRVYQGRGN